VREAYLIGIVFSDDLFLYHLEELYVVPWKNEADIFAIRAYEGAAESFLVCSAMPFEILFCRADKEAVRTFRAMTCDVLVGMLRCVYPQTLPLPDEAADLVEVRCVRVDPELLQPVEEDYAEWADEDEEYDFPYGYLDDCEEKFHETVDDIGDERTDIEDVPEVQNNQQANNGYSRRSDAPMNPFRPF
jgi:hypothetical protein